MSAPLPACCFCWIAAGVERIFAGHPIHMLKNIRHSGNRPLAGNDSSNGKKGGGCLILFGLVFGGMGLLFTILLARQLFADAETRRWTETLCLIERCEITIERQRDDPFRIDILYTYEAGGERHQSQRFGLQEKWSDDYEKLALQRKALLSGDGTVCYVNPADPTEAVIHRESLLTSLFGLIPLVFVAVGAGIIYAGVRVLRQGTRKSLASSAKERIAPSTPHSPSSRKAQVISGILFTLIGIGAGIPIFKGPIAKMAMSRHWMKTPCTVIWSRVKSHESDDSTTYSVDIFYEYQFAGQTHRSNRYRFMSGSSSGRTAKEGIVRKFSTGSQQICYVNPDLPEQAVILPGFSPVAFVALAPVAFLVIGLGLLISGKRDQPDPEPTGAESPEGALTLRPQASRGLKVGGTVLMALFWNGIVSIFVNEAVESWQVGSPDWFLTLFMIPFVLIGLALIVAFFYQLLALANPVPSLTLPCGMPRAGERFEVTWTLTGRVSRVNRLVISLWGVESVTYRRGTDTATSREVFFESILAEAVDLSDISAGRASVQLPEDLIPSLTLPNNAILYQIRVTGEVPLWPDLGDEYDVTLLPRRSDPVSS